MGTNTAILSPSSEFTFHPDTLAPGVWDRSLFWAEDESDGIEYMEELERDRGEGIIPRASSFAVPARS